MKYKSIFNGQNTFIKIPFLETGNPFCLGIEMKKDHLRLVVLQAETETCCRKVTVNKLVDYLKGGKGRAFAGRLQLEIAGKLLKVFFKEKEIGTVSLNDLLLKVDVENNIV